MVRRVVLEDQPVFAESWAPNGKSLRMLQREWEAILFDLRQTQQSVAPRATASAQGSRWIPTTPPLFSPGSGPSQTRITELPYQSTTSQHDDSARFGPLQEPALGASSDQNYPVARSSFSHYSGPVEAAVKGFYHGEPVTDNSLASVLLWVIWIARKLTPIFLDKDINTFQASVWEALGISIYNKIPTRYSVKATVPNALGVGYNPYKILDAMVARVTAGQVHKTLSDLKEKSERIAAENDFWTLAQNAADLGKCR